MAKDSETEQKSLLGGLTLMAATPIVAFIEMFRAPAVSTCMVLEIR